VGEGIGAGEGRQQLVKVLQFRGLLVGYRYPHVRYSIAGFLGEKDGGRVKGESKRERERGYESESRVKMD